MKTMNALRVDDLGVERELTRDAASELRGGLAKRGSPFAVSPLSAGDFIPGWDRGPSIEDAATAWDDSALYGRPPIR